MITAAAKQLGAIAHSHDNEIETALLQRGILIVLEQSVASMLRVVLAGNTGRFWIALIPLRREAGLAHRWSTNTHCWRRWIHNRANATC
jgi:hypothetical protein